MSSLVLPTQLASMNRQRERQKVLDAESRILLHLGVGSEQLMALPPHTRDVLDSRRRLVLGPLESEWDLYYSKAWEKMRKRGLASSKLCATETLEVTSHPLFPTVLPLDTSSIQDACLERRYDQGYGPFHRKEFDKYYTDPLVAQQMWDCGIVCSTDQPFEEVVVCIPKNTPKKHVDQFGIGSVRWSDESQRYYHGNLMKSGCQNGMVPNGNVGWNLERGVPQFNAGKAFLGASQASIDAEIDARCTNHKVHDWCPLASSRSDADISAGRLGRQAHKRIYMCMGHALDTK